PEPGDPEPAAAVRGLPAGDVHERPAQDGTIRQPAVGESAGVDGGGDHRRAEPLSAVPDVREPLMYRRILVAVENSPADSTILTHVSELARLSGAQLRPAEAARVGGDAGGPSLPRSTARRPERTRAEGRDAPGDGRSGD